MPLIIILFSFLFIMLFLAWNYNNIKKTKRNVISFTIFIVITTFVIVITRNGDILPDYDNYIANFYEVRGRSLELTFELIRDFVKTFSNNYLWMFGIYAMISISIRYYAIYKYSPFFLYSLCVWFATFLLLHEMIQIRAAVASALLLILLPNIYKKNYFKSLVIILTAFLFHRSALAFILLLFFDARKFNWKLWASMYIFCLVINISNSSIIRILGLEPLLLGFTVIEGDFYDVTAVKNSLSMFAPYIVLQTVTCIICIAKIKHIYIKYPLSIICVKSCCIGILLYSLPMGVISLRLAELFSTSFIFVYPLLLYCFQYKNSYFYGKLAVSIICIAILSNFIFIKGFIS